MNLDESQILAELKEAEDQVKEIVRATELTLELLGELPRCNEDKLIEQSSRYLGNLRQVQEKLKEHSPVFNSEKTNARAKNLGKSEFLEK